MFTSPISFYPLEARCTKVIFSYDNYNQIDILYLSIRKIDISGKLGGRREGTFNP